MHTGRARTYDIAKRKLVHPSLIPVDECCAAPRDNHQYADAAAIFFSKTKEGKDERQQREFTQRGSEEMGWGRKRGMDSLAWV